MPADAGSPTNPTKVDIHPLARDALRVSITPKEYRLLHEYALKRTPSSIKNQVPSPTRYESIVRPNNKHNEAAVRSSIRVFLVSGAAFKLADLVIARIQGAASKTKSKTSLINSPNFRLSVALSLVLLLHRLLYRFFVRLRANLRTDDATPFRARNPRISKVLTSRFSPAVGASAAGFALGISPQSQLRMTVAIYMATRSLEFLYNVLDQKGYCGNRPWWFGSWLLMPVSCAQLFHGFLFDRETTPQWFGKIILRFSPGYLQDRPDGFPDQLYWPGKEEIVDSLANIASLKWPPFVSPILHPANPSTLPASLKSISSITGPAHPSISGLSCALLHPGLPSCSTAFLHHILLSVPPLARFLTSITLALSAFKLKSIFLQPISAVNGLSKRIISLTAVFSASLGVAWGSVCFWNNLLSRSTLPTQRFYLSGALGGLPFMFLGNSRSTFQYFFRAAVDSAWKAGVKRGFWKGWRGGELWVIVLGWALMGAIMETRPSAVQGRGLRKGLAWMKGDGFTDTVEVLAKRKGKKAVGGGDEKDRSS